MLQICDILILENENDYDEEDVLWKDDDCIRLKSCGVIYNYKQAEYPQGYKRLDLWHNDFPEYVPCDNKEVCIQLKKFITDNKRKITWLELLLDRFGGDEND